MKIHPQKSERASITFILIVLLGIMMMLVAAEARALWQLRQETRLLEQRQIKRLNPVPANPPASTHNATNSVSPSHP